MKNFLYTGLLISGIVNTVSSYASIDPNSSEYRNWEREEDTRAEIARRQRAFESQQKQARERDAHKRIQAARLLNQNLTEHEAATAVALSQAAYTQLIEENKNLKAQLAAKDKQEKAHL